MKFAVLDFETTGALPQDEIIQVGLVLIDDSQIVGRYASFVNPKKDIPAPITALTGISREMVQDAPRLAEMMLELQPLLEDCVLVGHHISFDLGFLQKSLTQSGYPPFTGRVLDTIEMLRILFPSMNTFQLTLAAEYFGIAHDRPHQADSDADATASLWLVCLQQLLQLPLMTIQRLSQLFDPLSNDIGWFFQEMRVYKEMTTAVDVDANRYFRQFTLNVNDWDDTSDVESRHLADDDDSIDRDFSTFYATFKQSLQLKFEQYENRQAQEQMMTEVDEAFRDKHHLMVEAGTGTGKSLGYLIPALHYGIHHEQKVIVSTHTINLQEQLRERDLPMLQSTFPYPIKVAILKGRSHYMCLRKFENKINMKDFENRKEDPITAAQMIVWLSKTEHGDEEEIHFGQKGTNFWQTVASDADSCLNRQCPWFKKCFYHRAKYQAHDADLIITNHSLLFTDMKADHRLLPAYKHLIIDEAHHFEEVASKHLGTEMQSHRFVQTLQWLYKDNRTGYLPNLQTRLQKMANVEEQPSWIAAILRMIPHLVETKERWDLFSEKLCTHITARADRVATETGQYVLRFKPEQTPNYWPELTEIAQSILLNLKDIIKGLDKLVQDMKEQQDQYEIQSSLTDIGGIIKELTNHHAAFDFFMKLDDDNYVYWAELSQQSKTRFFQLYSVPIDVSHLLKKHFFDVKDSIVMTSATLAVHQSFQYSAEQIGLHIPQDIEEGKLKTVQLASPFRFKEQALVLVPRDFPDIKGNQGERYFIEKLLDSITEIAISTKGRMLVLFTSNRMLKDVHGVLQDRLQVHGIDVLGQGVGSGNRTKLIRMFQERPASVLLGTNSFWEGVDIPGDTLSCLAIVRLPFQPPNHPVVEAKCEHLKKRQENPFIKYSVPQAVIRFKQGFGRLVRTRTDRGVVIIYDTRVIDTTYGKHFLASLPGPTMESINTDSMAKRIEQWMEVAVNEDVKNF
jgi:ATP-dependent DNA helicase DinG